jgi:hypothetical protein
MNINFFLGCAGITLTIVEIWQPGLSVKLEKYIANQISGIEEFQKEYIKEFRALAKIADTSIKEVVKGPQLVTSEEFKINSRQSFEKIKSCLWFYLATAVNFIILKPINLILISLNTIGKGRSVGGIGILLAIGSTFL